MAATSYESEKTKSILEKLIVFSKSDLAEQHHDTFRSEILSQHECTANTEEEMIQWCESISHLVSLSMMDEPSSLESLYTVIDSHYNGNYKECKLNRYPEFSARAIILCSPKHALLEVPRQYRAAVVFPWHDYINLRFPDWGEENIASARKVVGACQFFFMLLLLRKDTDNDNVQQVDESASDSEGDSGFLSLENNSKTDAPVSASIDMNTTQESKNSSDHHSLSSIDDDDDANIASYLSSSDESDVRNNDNISLHSNSKNVKTYDGLHDFDLSQVYSTFGDITRPFRTGLYTYEDDDEEEEEDLMQAFKLSLVAKNSYANLLLEENKTQSDLEAQTIDEYKSILQSPHAQASKNYAISFNYESRSFSNDDPNSLLNTCVRKLAMIPTLEWYGLPCEIIDLIVLQFIEQTNFEELDAEQLSECNFAEILKVAPVAKLLQIPRNSRGQYVFDWKEFIKLRFSDDSSKFSSLGGIVSACDLFYLMLLRTENCTPDDSDTDSSDESDDDSSFSQ